MAPCAWSQVLQGGRGYTLRHLLLKGLHQSLHIFVPGCRAKRSLGPLHLSEGPCLHQCSPQALPICGLWSCIPLKTAMAASAGRWLVVSLQRVPWLVPDWTGITASAQTGCVALHLSMPVCQHRFCVSRLTTMPCWRRQTGGVWMSHPGFAGLQVVPGARSFRQAVHLANYSHGCVCGREHGPAG